jgi:hypothetical protein
MTRKNFVLALIGLLAAPLAFALTPATELYLASVGHGQGACVQGVCAEWRTTVWVTNLNTVTATLEIAFLQRGQNNLSPREVSASVAPNQTVEFADIFADTFHLDGVFGAIRISSNILVTATARTYDANVHTSKGVGTGGQDLAGLPFEIAVPPGESTEIAGLEQDAGGLWRSNFGFVEVMGQACTVQAELLDGNGNVLGSKSYQLAAFEALQPSITDIGGPLGANQRVRLTVTSTTGAIIPFGSRIDNTTGDPTTMEMIRGRDITPLVLAGTWSGPYQNYTYGYAGTATIQFTVDAPDRTFQATLTLTGTFTGFGGNNPPPPQTLGGVIVPAGLTLTQGSSLLTSPSGTFDHSGVISATCGLFYGGSVIGTITITGHTDGKTMDLGYFINYTAQVGGGGEAVHVTLTKS